MNTAYATHEDYTNDAPRHLQKIAGMIESATLPDESTLHGSQTYSHTAHLQLKIPEEFLPKSAGEYEKWKDNLQWELGLALGHYDLVANTVNAGDGSEAAYNRWEAQYSPASPGKEQDEASTKAHYEELKSSGTVSVNVITKEMEGIYQQYRSGELRYISDKKRDYEKVEAEEKLQMFHDDLHAALHMDMSSAISPRGPGKIAEEQRLKSTLKESIAHFDEVSIGGVPSETGEIAVTGAIELKAKLAKHMLERAWKGIDSQHPSWGLINGDDYVKDIALQNMGSGANNRIKGLIGRDLDKYGLVPISGTFDKETQTYTFHVLDKERYGQILNEGGQIDPAKSFGTKEERPALEDKTREGLDNYIAAFNRARELGLDEVAARGL